MTGECLRRNLPVDITTPTAVRRLLGPWLRGIGCIDEQVDDLTLVVDEAVANATEHAFPDGADGESITVDAAVVERDAVPHIVLTITDRGRWRPPPPDNGFRGRGLQLMRALTDSVEFDDLAHGTRVRLTSRLRGAAAGSC
ncbi:MAG TPA: ATP-binding protein [Pseudonocardia sp.]